MRAIELVAKYFKLTGYEVERNVTLRGRWGLKHTFDLLIMDGNRLLRGVWVKDWRRTVGINVAVRLDRASEDVGLSRPVLVANRFSPSVCMYASKRGIWLITFEDILSFLKRPVLTSKHIPYS